MELLGKESFTYIRIETKRMRVLQHAILILGVVLQGIKRGVLGQRQFHFRRFKHLFFLFVAAPLPFRTIG